MSAFVIFVSCDHLIWIQIWGHVADIFSIIPLRAEVVLEFSDKHLDEQLKN